jgi:hypothetical protein
MPGYYVRNYLLAELLSNCSVALPAVEKSFSLEKNSPFHNQPEMHPLKLSDAKPVPLHVKYVVTRM